MVSINNLLGEPQDPPSDKCKAAVEKLRETEQAILSEDYATEIVSRA